MITLDSLLTKYLTWCATHRAPRSLEWYTGHIEGFRKFLGDNAQMDCQALKPFHIVEWVDSHPKWGDTNKGGAIISIKRVYSWSEEMGYIEVNPIKKLKKPTAKRRDNHMKPDDFERILAKLRAGDPFRDIFLFAWHSGARPQECRHIEPRHVNLERGCIVFPKEESKGKRKARVIHLFGESLEIITRLMAQGREGKIFLNNRHTPWTKYALCNRMHRLSKETGRKFAMYDARTSGTSPAASAWRSHARHGFATRKLIQGHDHLTIAALMGHTDGSMLAKVYSHIDSDDAHLKKALID